MRDKPKGTRYRTTKAGPGERVVHNFPANGRPYGLDGFRYWVEPEESEGAGGASRVRCYCGWLDGREHYGTVAVVDARGKRVPT